MADDLRLKLVGTGVNPWDPSPDRTLPGTEIPTTIRYSVIDGPSFQVSPSGPKATYRFRIHVNDVQEWQQSVLGWAEQGVGGFLKRYLPMIDPDNYGFIAEASNCVGYEGPSGFVPSTEQRSEFFQDITGRDFAGGLWARMFNYAIMEVQFTKPFYNVVRDADMGGPATPSERDRFCVATETMSTEYVQLDRGVVYWTDAACPAVIGNGGDPIKVAAGGGLQRNLGELVITWYRLPADAYATLRPIWTALLSTVNADDFVVTLPGVNGGGITYPAETLLFRPWQMQPVQNGSGDCEYNVQLHWAIRQVLAVDGPAFGGWNHFLYVDGKYYEAGWKDAAVFRDIYPQEDHETIFQP